MISAKEDIIEMLLSQKETLRSYHIHCTGLFGSFTKERNNEDSDVDLLLEFEP